MKKVRQIDVYSRLQSRSYEDKDSKMVYVTEVVADNIQFLEPRGSSPSQVHDTSGPQQGQYQQGQQSQNIQSQRQEPKSDVFKSEGEPIDISDDDLPF